LHTSTKMSSNYEQMKAVIKAAKVRWLTIQECVDILANYRSHGFPLSNQPALRPSPSGSVFLYNAETASDWFEDGYNWKIPGPGDYTNSEEVAGFGELLCVENVHPTAGFRRRGYWLTQQPSIVLVHYLSGMPEPNGLDVYADQRRHRMVAPPPPNGQGFDDGRNQMGARRINPRNMARQDPSRGPGNVGGGYDPLVPSTFIMMQGGMDGDGKKMPEDKSLKRKARKAEVARACRRRKKAYIQSLEEKASRLQQQLSSMARTQNGEASHRRDQDHLIQLIRNAVNDGEQDRQIQQIIQKFVGNSRKRQRTSSSTYVNKVKEQLFQRWKYSIDLNKLDCKLGSTR